MRETMEEAGVRAQDVGYVEAHCTGTQAGDPVELNALHDVFCKGIETLRRNEMPLHIGCLKSNMGHSEGASGMCAIVKAVLVMERGLIPPNLHLNQINPNIIGLVDGTQKAVTSICPLPSDIVSVNCFGFGGANTHVILKRNSAIKKEAALKDRMPRILCYHSRTKMGIQRMEEFLSENGKEGRITNGLAKLLQVIFSFSTI